MEPNQVVDKLIRGEYMFTAGRHGAQISVFIKSVEICLQKHPRPRPARWASFTLAFYANSDKDHTPKSSVVSISGSCTGSFQARPPPLAKTTTIRTMQDKSKRCKPYLHLWLHKILLAPIEECTLRRQHITNAHPCTQTQDDTDT